MSFLPSPWTPGGKGGANKSTKVSDINLIKNTLIQLVLNCVGRWMGYIHVSAEALEPTQAGATGGWELPNVGARNCLKEQ